jgi:glutamine synthetase
MNPQEVIQFAREHGAKMVDFKFVDMPGTWQHFSTPIRELEDETFVEGKPFDGSSVRAFQDINNTYQDLRSEMALLLEELGVRVETQHHKVGAPGQAKIDIRFNTLLQTADNIMLYKYVMKNTERKHGKTAKFIPKSVFGDNGSGMHVHQSLWTRTPSKG